MKSHAGTPAGGGSPPAPGRLEKVAPWARAALTGLGFFPAGRQGRDCRVSEGGHPAVLVTFACPVPSWAPAPGGAK